MLILTWKSFFLAAVIAAVAVHCTSSSSELWHDDEVKKVPALSITKKEKAAPQDHEFTMLTADDPEISEFREAFAFSRLLPPEAPVSNSLPKQLQPRKQYRDTDTLRHVKALIHRKNGDWSKYFKELKGGLYNQRQRTQRLVKKSPASIAKVSMQKGESKV